MFYPKEKNKTWTILTQNVVEVKCWTFTRRKIFFPITVNLKEKKNCWRNYEWNHFLSLGGKEKKTEKLKGACQWMLTETIQKAEWPPSSIQSLLWFAFLFTKSLSNSNKNEINSPLAPIFISTHGFFTHRPSIGSSSTNNILLLWYRVP